MATSKRTCTIGENITSPGWMNPGNVTASDSTYTSQDERQKPQSKEDRHVVLQIDDVHQTIEFTFNTGEKENG